MNQVTTAIGHKKKPANDQEVLPVYLRVTYKRIPYYFEVAKLCRAQLVKLSAPRLGKELATVRDEINAEHDRAKAIIKTLHPFCIQSFRVAFKSTGDQPAPAAGLPATVLQLPAPAAQEATPAAVSPASLDHVLSAAPQQVAAIRELTEPEGFTFSGHTGRYGKSKFTRIRSNMDYSIWGPLSAKFGAYIRQLETEEKVSTAGGYFSTLVSLVRFQVHVIRLQQTTPPPADQMGDLERQLRGLDLFHFLTVHDITKPFMVAYHKWMQSQKKSLTTIGMYGRNLRSIFNQCIADGEISRDCYPFGIEKDKYQIPTGANRKKALKLEQVKVLYDYNASHSERLELGRDMWFFLFFGNGMNVKDLAMLKWGDIDGDFIRFTREKTKNTVSGNPIKITVSISEDMRYIIQRWGNRNRHPEQYIFPILKPGVSAFRVRELVQLFTKCINEAMAAIVEATKLGVKVTCMTARHSYATILKRKGASPEYIREALGHTSLATTQKYLDSFDDDMIKQTASLLEDFKKLPDQPRPDQPGQLVEINPNNNVKLLTETVCAQAI